MHIQCRGGIVPPPSQNPVAVRNQITFVILHYISSRLVTLLKITDAPMQVSNILDLTVSFKFLNFRFVICLLLLLNCLLASRLSLFKLPTFLCLGHLSTVFYPASFDLRDLNILHPTMVYAASIREYLDCF